MYCSECGVEMTQVQGDIKNVFLGEEISIPSMSYDKCEKCGKIRLHEGYLIAHENQLAVEKTKMLVKKGYTPVFVNLIKNVRNHKGLSQDTLGFILGVKHNRISNIENNVNTLRVDKSCMLALHLNCKVDDICKVVYMKNELLDKCVKQKHVSLKNEFYYMLGDSFNLLNEICKPDEIVTNI